MSFLRASAVSCLVWLLFSGPVLAEPPVPAKSGDVEKVQTEGEKGQPKPAKKAKRGKENKEPESKFLRIRRDDKGEPLALETSVVRFVPADDTRAGLSVDLIGAVHVGDKAYYDELNRVFTSYDALLYELVAPEGTRIPKEGRKDSGGNPVAALQMGMKSLLELEFQLEKIYSTKENFVHADMSPEEFLKSMEKRGESFLKMFLRMISQASAQNQDAAGASDVEILFALFAKDRAFRLKRLFAGQFENMDGAMAALNGPEGSTIITERNRKAFEVLAREIDDGKKKLGVFYGAGHLADMEQRLLKDFRLKRAEEKWLAAWSLEPAKAKPIPKEPAAPAKEAKTEEKPEVKE